MTALRTLLPGSCRRFAPILCALILLSSGCGHKKPASRLNSPPSRYPWFHLSLNTVPKHPRQLDKTDFYVTVVDPNGDQVNNASVTISVSMPSMPMPNNTITLERGDGPGQYVGTGRFTMPGDWVARGTARIKNTPKKDWTASQEFPISVSP